ncbi:hypothetical protein GC175_28380 [bacterium]|nr:hypothetical protein [bacterium]
MKGCLKTAFFILFFPITIPIWLWQRGWPGKVGALLFVLVFAVAVGSIPTPEERVAIDARATVIAGFPTGTPTPVPAATNTAVPVVVTVTPIVATDTPVVMVAAVSLPTSTSEPVLIPTLTATPVLTEQQRLYSAIEDALREGNRDYPRLGDVGKVLDVINVRWALNDNFQVRDGALLDMVDMLKAIQSTGINYYIVNFEGTFPLIDVYGNSAEETVMWATFESEEVDRINWDRFPWKNILLIASTTKEHPALAE